MTTAIAKRNPIVKIFLEGVEPAPLLKNAGAVAAGFGAAKLGGAFAKQITAVENFANKGEGHEAAVDFGAGCVLDAVLVVIAYKWKGADVAVKLAGLAVVGTALGATATLVAPHLAHYVETAVNAFMKLIGHTPKPSGATAAAAVTAAATKNVNAPLNGASGPTIDMSIGTPAGLYQYGPGGLYQYGPGGTRRSGPYALAAQ